MPNHVLVQVPRALWGKYSELPWADVVKAAEEGRDGLVLVDVKTYGFAYLRQGDKGGMLDGKASLYHQAWV